MLDFHPRAALPLVSLLALAWSAGCSSGGGSGGDETGSQLVSAGANRTVLTNERVFFTATAPASSGVEAFEWRQTAGPAVTLTGASNATVSVYAPDRAGTIELEVSGRRTSGTLVDRDRVILEVESTRPELRSELRSTIEIRGGGEGRAMASAVHAGTGRLFVIDGVAGDVLAYDVSAPASLSSWGRWSRPRPHPATPRACPGGGLRRGRRRGHHLDRGDA